MYEIPFDETDFVERLIERDENALSELYQRFGGLVYSVALHVVQNPGVAEEVTQDSFLKIWQQPETWDPRRGRFVGWLLTITRYTAIDRLRKEQRRPFLNSVELDDLRMGHQAIVEGESWEDARILRSMLDCLPYEQMQVIELAYFQGMSHSEMAEYLELPLGTVKTRVRLGLQKLKVYRDEEPVPILDDYMTAFR